MIKVKIIGIWILLRETIDEGDYLGHVELLIIMIEHIFDC